MESEDDEEPPNFCNRIPKRYITTVLMCFFLTHGLVCKMVVEETTQILANLPKNDSTEIIRSSLDLICKNLKDIKQELQVLPNVHFEWDEKDILKSFRWFYYTFLLSEFIFGYVCDRFGPKHVITASIVVNSLLNLVTPSFIQISKSDYLYVIILQLIFGLCQGPVYPCTISVLSHWLPPRERAFLFCVGYSGALISRAMVKYFTKSIIFDTGNWALPMYLSGSLGFVLFLVWWKCGYAYPQNCPDILDKEQFYLDMEMGDTVSDLKNKPVPLFSILKSPNVLVLILACFTHTLFWNVGRKHFFQLLDDIYLHNEEESRLWRSLPFVVMILSGLVLGYLSDWATKRQYMDTETARKVFTNISTMGPSIYLITASFAGCNKKLSHTLFLLSMMLDGCVMVGIRVVPLDITPNYAATVFSIVNFFSNSSALYGYLIINMIEIHDGEEHSALEKYRIFCFMSLPIALIANVVFITVCKVRVESWNKPKLKQSRKK